ncbi:NadC/P/Pho87 family transporter [Streptomyces himastatinicus ATCC 53653]|uniref:NadC/P/Pho87 family transporter n=1 Tax=Streptomyces himastatinicus ATCC 53653 TaxID=457427 RepID=D9WVY3_9ACTN|nr:NadC/P/Pho87 family transporter [Streptomyces himastatinicus ATCC 53653]
MSDWHCWAAIAVFVVAYVAIISERVHRTAAALAGAAAMLDIGATDDKAAFFDEHPGIDWNVVFLLLGMMAIVGVLRQTGLFEYLAIWAAKRARGKPFRVMTMLIVITASASALLDNVTTVLLVAPVTLLVCERLALPAAPFLIAEVLASNIGGTATLVGDPPNIIIASRGGLTFNDFLVHLAPIAALLTVVLVLLCRVMFRKALVYDEQHAAEVMALEEREAIRDHRLLYQGLGVLALVVFGFVAHPVLHYAPSVVALLGGGLLIAISKVETGEALKEVEWPTLAFFAGRSSWSARSSRPVSSERSPAPSRTPPAAVNSAPRCCCCSARLCCPGSSTTSPTSPPWLLSPPTWPTASAAVTVSTCCGGPSPWAQTWAATPRPSAPPPMSSSWASPNATASPSPSGSSPGTAWSSPP